MKKVFARGLGDSNVSAVFMICSYGSHILFVSELEQFGCEGCSGLRTREASKCENRMFACKLLKVLRFCAVSWKMIMVSRAEKVVFPKFDKFIL